MFKDHDRAIIGFQIGKHSGNDHTKHVDEVSNCLEARYVSAPEAYYIGYSLMNSMLISHM